MRRRDLLVLVSGMMAAPHRLRAQQKAMPVVGFLNSISPGPNAPFTRAFLQGLSETGYVARQNVAIEYRWADSRFEQLPALAAELVARKVDVIAATGDNASARAAKNATSTIPIVFTFGDDPVGLGLIASLARPGGNLTGVSFMLVELGPKRLELLSELVPWTRSIALLVNPNNANAQRTTAEARDATRAKRVQLQILRAASESEIDAAFAFAVRLHAGALVIGPDPYFLSRRKQLVALAADRALPVMYFGREFAVAGGLVSYGPSIAAAYRQAGIYVGKILKGAKPADLPVQQPTTFELVINLKTAEALGLTVPPSILAHADEVIE